MLLQTQMPTARKSFLGAIVGCALLIGLSCLSPGRAQAGGGPFGIDHEWNRSDTGIWSRDVQVGLEYGAIATAIGGALWLGNEDPLGHTMWQSVDALTLSGVAVHIMKVSFSRARPSQGNDPNLWFQGHGHQSFPSGEVSVQAAFVAPFIFDYQHETPWIWALEILPAYDAVARLKSQAHWQSDVAVGWALGTGFGYLATRWRVPLMVRILPGGAQIGLQKRF
jgi:hypothetical protein